MTSPPNRPRGSARVPGPTPDGPGGAREPGQPSGRYRSGQYGSNDSGAGRHGGPADSNPSYRSPGAPVGGETTGRHGRGYDGGEPTGSGRSRHSADAPTYGQPRSAGPGRYPSDPGPSRHGAEPTTGRHGEPTSARHSVPGGNSGRHSVPEPATGSARVGPPRGTPGPRTGSVGSASVGSASVGGASVGSASVGSAPVGGPSGRASVRPPGPDDNGDFFSDSFDEIEKRERADRRRAAGTPRAKKRMRRRRIIAGIAVLLLLAGLGTIGGAYYFTSVPLPENLAAKVPSTFYYSDGKTQMAKLGASNGSHVDVSKLPKYVKYSVVSAEDRSFYKNSGVDFKGILRATWGHVTGNDDAGGASTITMQYAKLIEDRLQNHRTYTEKVKETAIAMKLSQKYDKDTILGFYLDLAYFNRGATGIQAAAKTYFNKDATKLTPEEAAVLASIIKDPTQYDPQVNKKAAQDRWVYVLEGMKQLGVYNKPISMANYPKVRPDDPNSHGATFGLDKPTGFVVSQVIDELTDKQVLSQDPDRDKRRDATKQALETGGYKIVTTINKTAQDDAVEAAHYGIKEAKPYNPKIATALVAVEPGTGNVLAYYGGDNGTGYDMAGNAHQPGSSFKVYTLAAGVQAGYSVKSYWNGDADEKFDDRGGDGKVHNSDGEECHDAGHYNGHDYCTLYNATAMSLNTVFYALSQKVGKANVLKLAHDAGITAITSDGQKTGKPTTYSLANVGTEQAAQDIIDKGGFGNEIGFGQYPVSPLDHANGYATFANNGVYTEQHFVTRLIDADGNTKYTPKKVQRTVFSKTVAADIDWVLRKVATQERQMITPYRQQANKTGTWEFPNKNNENQNSHAWMCGYVPQLASTVWMGRKDEDGPIWNQRHQPLYGSEFPSDVWSRFMSNALRDLNKPAQDFPTPTFSGKLTGQYASPSPSPSPSSASPTPSQNTPSPSYSVPGWPGNTNTPDPGQSSCSPWDPACTRRNNNVAPNAQSTPG